MSNPKSNKHGDTKIKPAPYADAAVNDEDLTSEHEKHISEDKNIRKDSSFNGVDEIEEIEIEDVDDLDERPDPDADEHFEE